MIYLVLKAICVWLVFSVSRADLIWYCTGIYCLIFLLCRYRRQQLTQSCLEALFWQPFTPLSVVSDVALYSSATCVCFQKKNVLVIIYSQSMRITKAWASLLRQCPVTKRVLGIKSTISSVHPNKHPLHSQTLAAVLHAPASSIYSQTTASFPFAIDLQPRHKAGYKSLLILTVASSSNLDSERLKPTRCISEAERRWANRERWNEGEGRTNAEKCWWLGAKIRLW